MKFFASRDHTDVALIIEAPTWHEAKQYADRAIQGVGALVVHQTEEDAVADIALQWVGTDSGTKPNRRRQIKRRTKNGDWTQWEDLRT